MECSLWQEDLPPLEAKLLEQQILVSLVQERKTLLCATKSKDILCHPLIPGLTDSGYGRNSIIYWNVIQATY